MATLPEQIAQLVSREMPRIQDYLTEALTLSQKVTPDSNLYMYYWKENFLASLIDDLTNELSSRAPLKPALPIGSTRSKVPVRRIPKRRSGSGDGPFESGY